jgi:conserved domain protein
VLRVDFTQNRSLSIELKENTTTLRRDSDVWELQIASIHVKQNAMAINQSDITDTRLDSNVCGVVTSVINQVDTTTIFNQYMDYWNRKKAENETKWQEQMNSQEKRFVEQKDSIEAWYASVKANISLLKTFDFDNIAELNGSKRETTFNGDGSIYELISISANGRKIAERTTSFLGDGRISVNIKVYKDNGTTVVKQSTTVTTFNGNGTISEVVS